MEPWSHGGSGVRGGTETGQNGVRSAHRVHRCMQDENSGVRVPYSLKYEGLGLAYRASYFLFMHILSMGNERVILYYKYLSVADIHASY